MSGQWTGQGHHPGCSYILLHNAPCDCRVNEFQKENRAPVAMFGPPQEMVSLTQIKAALGRIEENQGKILAAIDAHDAWAKGMNAEAVKNNAQHSADWNASAKAHREAGEAVVDLLKKMLDQMQYTGSVVNNLYDMQPRSRFKKPARPKKQYPKR